MSRLSRRLFASFRRFAVASFCCATLVGFVGCAGGSNPFCCDSKEKSQIDQNLERAQSLDEREKDAETTESQDQGAEDEKSEKTTIHANILRSDGSGDATQIADATTSTPKTFATEPQETPVTVSTTAAAQETSALTDDSAGLLQAPVLPSTIQTSQTPQAASSTSSDLAPTSENKLETANETPNANAANPAQTTDPETEDVQTTTECQEAQDKQNTQETPTENADDATETQEEKTPTIYASRSPRRDGPQRAATRQVAQRVAKPPVAVPQTRAAATLSEPTPVVTFRTRTVAPAVAPPAAPTSVVTFRTRTVVP